MNRAAGLIVVQPDERAHRFIERRRLWRTRTQKFYARHAEVEPHAPIILSAMFDRAVAIVGPMREYAMRGFDLPTVRLNVDTDATKPWFWYTACGSAEGRGLYELWAWQFDAPVANAAEDIWLLIHAGGK